MKPPYKYLFTGVVSTLNNFYRCFRQEPGSFRVEDHPGSDPHGVQSEVSAESRGSGTCI